MEEDFNDILNWLANIRPHHEISNLIAKDVFSVLV